MSQSSPPESPPPTVEHEHPDVTGGWLRPAVFGAMDGLVSNAALIAGVAGGTRDHPNASAVVLAGLAGLAAGAFSMAAGEYASVASQSEAAAHEVARERREIIANPEAETTELAAMFTDKGIEPDLAQEMAEQVHRDLENAVAVHSIEEFGIDPDDLASPLVAAVSSFVAFALGALVPVLPYLFGVETLAPAIVLTLLALFACGAMITRITVRRWWFGGLRQVLLGGAAFGLTYVVGMGVGAGLA
jgi:VIT1/CCC1 family predicted Fe2+/Mn2+ transporter